MPDTRPHAGLCEAVEITPGTVQPPEQPAMPGKSSGLTKPSRVPSLHAAHPGHALPLDEVLDVLVELEEELLDVLDEEEALDVLEEDALDVLEEELLDALEEELLDTAVPPAPSGGEMESELLAPQEATSVVPTKSRLSQRRFFTPSTPGYDVRSLSLPSFEEPS